MKAKSAFKVGDLVQPKSEWIGGPNKVPTGEVLEIAPWGNIGSLRVGGDWHFWSAHVFDLVPRGTEA